MSGFGVSVKPRSIFRQEKTDLVHYKLGQKGGTSGQCLQQTQLLHNFCFELWTVWILDLLFWSRIYPHRTFQTNRLKVRIDTNKKTIAIMVYPKSLCMAHTQETGKISDNPNWLPVDQCGFGGQFMHISKSVIDRIKKKNRALQIWVFHSIHADGGASARLENCAWSTL